MSDPISGLAAQQLTQQSVADKSLTEQSFARRDANPQHQAEFESAMNGVNGPGGVEQTSAVQGTLETGQVDAAGKIQSHDPTSLGEALLDSLDRLKIGHDNRMKAVANSLEEMNDAPNSVSAAMKLQFELMQMSIEHDLTAKVADKTSQGVQTLFRNSG